MDTEFVSTGNIIEGCFWLGVSVFFWVPAFRRGEKNRGFCFYGAAVFVCSACSDFYEAHTGAWWQPWWLILWNMGHFLGLEYGALSGAGRHDCVVCTYSRIV